MDGSPAPTVVTTIPSFTTTPRPSHTTVTISTASNALPFVAANVSAYGVDNPASPHHNVIVPVAANASKFVFGVPTLREDQVAACLFLLDPLKPRVLLNVDRTGSGKTHVTRVVGLILNRIIVIITPLLTLSADQKAKSLVGDQRYALRNNRGTSYG